MNSAWHCLTARLVAKRLALLALLCFVFSNPALGQSASAPPSAAAAKNILLLYSYGHGSKGINLFNDGLIDALNASGIGTNNLFFEFLDLERNQADPQYRSRLHAFLLQKYADRRIDLIVTGQQPALNFLLKEGRNLVAGVAAITVQAPMPAAADAGNRQFVSLLSSFDIKGTLERAMELFPGTQRVVFVSGSSEADRKMAAAAARVAAPWQAKLAFEYTSDLPLQTMLARVANLPPHSIIIFTQYNRDVSGQVTVAYEVEHRIVQKANAPVFGLYDFNLHNGGIGGSVVGVNDLGKRAGQLALDLMNGKLRLSQPVSSVAINPIPMFDWRQIARWGGDASRLPADSVFVNRVPTFWEQYRAYVIGLTIFFLTQSLLIAALLVNKRYRSQAEKALQKTQALYHDLVETSQDLIWQCDAEGRYTYLNPAWEKVFGYKVEDMLGKRFSDFQSPEMAARDQKEYRRLMQGNAVQGFETVHIGRGGNELNLVFSAKPLTDEKGTVVGTRGTAFDLTERKRAEALIQDYVAQLQTTFMSTVKVATMMSEMRDPYTAGHERRVGEIAVAIGAELGFDARRQEGLRVAGYLHDIGKITIPAEILSKPGQLSPIELQLIQGHAQASYDVLKGVEFPWPVAQVVLQHHERMDGSGYPRGLKGEAIMLEARIIAIADVIEAMSSHRPYRHGLGIEMALAEIERGSASVYCPLAAAACLKLFREKGYALPA